MSSLAMFLTSLLSIEMFQVATSPLLLSAMRSALTSSSLRSSHHWMCSSGISVQPSSLQASTRVWPQTMVGSSWERSTIEPLNPNSRMESATTGMAFSLWRAFLS